MRLLFYIAGSNAESWLEALRREFPDARIDGWPSALAGDAEYALVWKPPVELLRALGKVKAIFNLGAGVDSMPDVSVLPRNARLVRLEDAGMAEQMAEYVCHAVLHRYREFDAYAEQQQSAEWRQRPRLPKSEFTVCLLPLTSRTQGLLDRARLSRLPRGAYVVNVSRGGLVVDEDLLALLDNEHLTGATLDVFRDEPLPPEHRFWHHPRVTLTPHVSAVTLVQESVAQIAAKIRCLEAGLPITGVVGRERGY